MKKITIIFFATLCLSSCSLQKAYLKFEKRSNEVITTDALKNVMNKFAKPSIVLKVPNVQSSSSQADPNAYIYNAIEKELMLSSFVVRDRSLFNEVLNNSNSVSYKELGTITKTDILLDLVSIETNVEFVTNRMFKKNGKEIVVPYKEFKKIGTAIEFNVTVMETNEIAGSFSLYFTPCSENNYDCECEVGFKKYGSKIKTYDVESFCNNEEVDSKEAYEYYNQNQSEIFIRNEIKRLIRTMKAL